MNKKDTSLSAPLYPATYAWLGMVVVYCGFMAVGWTFHCLPPVLPLIIADLGISHGQAGLLMSLFALPGVLFSFPAGWLVDRFGERIIGGTGLLLMGLGIFLMAQLSTFPLLMAARTVTGIGAMIGVVALQRMVTRLFQGRPLGLPMGIAGSALPVGVATVLIFTGPTAEAAGWRLALQSVGIGCLGVAVLFLLAAWPLLRKARTAPGTGSATGTVAGATGCQVSAADLRRGFRAVWLAAVAWFGLNGAMTSFMTFAPDHFLGLGFGTQERGLFTSLPMWVSAPIGPLVGLLADRRGGKPVFIFIGMSLLTVCLAAIALGLQSPVLIGLGLGTGLAVAVTPLLSSTGDALPPSHHGRGFGILSTGANIGIFTVPPLTGLVRDASGDYFWPFMIMAALTALGIALAEVLRRGRYLAAWGRPGR